MLNINDYIEESVTDGPGVRLVLFLQGCPHHCKGCHNPQTWDFVDKYKITNEAVVEMLEYNPLIRGITISGGEPMCQDDELWTLLKRLKELDYSTIVYTGYTYDDVKDNKSIPYIDYLVDGRFDITKKSLDCLYRGSTNQRIIDVAKTREKGTVVEVDYNTFGQCV